MGGARIEEVHVEDVSPTDSRLDVRIAFEAPSLDRAVFCLGFVDEGGAQVGSAASQPLPVDRLGEAVTCTIQPLPLRSGIYFPVVAILSEDGLVRDRWQLDRAVVIERNGDGSALDDFGPVDISASWWADDEAVENRG
jgi:hypothetical protein